MKKIFLALIILCFTLEIAAQRDRSSNDRSITYEEWVLSVGFNTINSLGTKGPFNNPGDWAFKFPLTASIETKRFDWFTIELGFSLNGISEDSRIDAAGPPTEDLTYFSIDTSLKYYFGEHIFPRTEWLDFYANAGLGYFILNDSNISVNFGGGALFWLNDNRTFGIKAQGLAKVAFNRNDVYSYANNHFQYSLQAVFKL